MDPSLGQDGLSYQTADVYFLLEAGRDDAQSLPQRSICLCWSQHFKFLASSV